MPLYLRIYGGTLPGRVESATPIGLARSRMETRRPFASPLGPFTIVRSRRLAVRRGVSGRP